MRDPLRRFLFGAILSIYGDWLTTVALVVLVVRVTGSSAAPAGYMLTRVIPRFLGSGPGGALADRVGAARVAAGCAASQGLLTASIIPAGRAGSAAGIYTAVVLAQVVAGISRAATGAIIPSVAAGPHLGSANALYNIGQASAVMVAPAVGAPLLALRGPDLLLLLDAGTFAVAAVLMLTLPAQAVVRDGGESLLQAAAAGIATVRRDACLRTLAAAYFSEAMAVTLAGSVLVLAAHDRFGGASNVGYLYAAVGIGDAAGGLLTLHRDPPAAIRPVVASLGLFAILALAAVVEAHQLWFALVALAANGVGETAYVSWGATAMQRQVDLAVLGRVNGAVVMAANLGMIVGAVLAIALVPTVGWPAALFAGCSLAAVSLVALALSTPTRPASRRRVVVARGGDEARS